MGAGKGGRMHRVVEVGAQHICTSSQDYTHFCSPLHSIISQWDSDRVGWREDVSGVGSQGGGIGSPSRLRRSLLSVRIHLLAQSLPSLSD